MNIVQTRGGPRDAGPPSVDSLGGQHSVSIDLTMAPNVSTMLLVNFENISNILVIRRLK